MRCNAGYAQCEVDMLRTVKVVVMVEQEMTRIRGL